MGSNVALKAMNTHPYSLWGSLPGVSNAGSSLLHIQCPILPHGVDIVLLWSGALEVMQRSGMELLGMKF